MRSLIGRHPNLRVEIRPTDLSQREAVDELIAWVGGAEAAIDLLINNAGLGDIGRIFDRRSGASRPDDAGQHGGLDTADTRLCCRP